MYKSIKPEEFLKHLFKINNKLTKKILMLNSCSSEYRSNFMHVAT